MSDINEFLVEMHEILGNLSKVEEIEASEKTPADAARLHLREGLNIIDEVILGAIAKLEWDAIAEMAALAVLPPQDVVDLARALKKSTAEFRNEWRSVNESYEMPFVLSRGGMITASNISPDEELVGRIVRWSKVVLGEASKRTKKAVAKKHPASAYVPAGDKTKAKKEASATKEYMTPHEAQTDKPSAKKKVMDTRQLNPGDEKKDQKKDLKTVEKDIKKLEAAAKKAGKKPEEMFPRLWTDLQREKVRNS